MVVVCDKICGKMCGKIEKLSDWNKNWCGIRYGPRDYDSGDKNTKRQKDKKTKRQKGSKNARRQKRQKRQQKRQKTKKDNNNKVLFTPCIILVYTLSRVKKGNFSCVLLLLLFHFNICNFVLCSLSSD